MSKKYSLVLNIRKTKRRFNRPSSLCLLQLHPSPVTSRLLITPLPLNQRLHPLNEYKGKLGPKICKMWEVTRGVRLQLHQSTGWWPSGSP